MRADRHRKNLPNVPKNTFMPIFKQYNMNLNLEDQDNLLHFLRIDAPKNCFNLANLNRLFEI
jgi:hypothetical protein